jgi:hypothetical protein
MPLFLSTLARTLDRHRPAHPEIVLECAGIMWRFVRKKLVKESTPMMGPLCPVAPYAAPIFAHMLPYVFGVIRLDRVRVHVVRDALTVFATAIACDQAAVVAAIVKAKLWDKLSAVAACIDVPDFDTQRTAIEILANLKDHIGEGAMMGFLPVRLHEHWPKLCEPSTFCEEVRVTLTAYNASKLADNAPPLPVTTTPRKRGKSLSLGNKRDCTVWHCTAIAVQQYK